MTIAGIAMKEVIEELAKPGEARCLGPKTWQRAYQGEDPPKPGGYQLYDVGHYSALVIRGKNKNIRACLSTCFFPGIEIPLIYRFRPNSAGTCRREILILGPLPDAGTRPPPAAIIRRKVEESYAAVDDFALGFVLALDTPLTIV